MERRQAEKEKIEILQRYCDNSFTTEDLKTILAWFTEPGHDIIRRITMKIIWSETAGRDFSGSQTSYQEDLMLDSIHHRINRIEAEKPGDRHRVKRDHSFFYIFSRIAAVLFIPLLLTSLIYLNQKANIFLPDVDLKYTELHAPPFARVSFYLADSTKVWLNNGSSLEYPIDFTGRDRKVYLQGEAYFDVRKDQSRPFNVETGDIIIQVLGTKFNIMNYEEDQAITTTLEEGKVLVRASGQGRNNPVIHELTPSRQSIYLKESRDTKVRTVNTASFTSWKDGRLFLLDDPMREVKKKLERWYNVDIVIEDPEILEYRYTGTFHQEPLEMVLRMMTIATPIRYKLKKGTKQSDNTYSRDTIIIRKK